MVVVGWYSMKVSFFAVEEAAWIVPLYFPLHLPHTLRKQVEVVRQQLLLPLKFCFGDAAALPLVHYLQKEEEGHWEEVSAAVFDEQCLLAQCEPDHLPPHLLHLQKDIVFFEN